MGGRAFCILEISAATRQTLPDFARTDEELAAFLGETYDGRLSSEGDRKAATLRMVEEARNWWEARQGFRDERREARDFYRGRQWEGTTTDADGRATTERALLSSQGRQPVVMNLIAPLIANVEGQFRQNQSQRLAFAVERKDEKATRMLNVAREGIRRRNQSRIIESDQFLEHLLSGASSFKSTFEFDPRTGRSEVVDYEVDQHRLFYNLDVHDRRLKGLRCIGELHDVTPQEAVRRFARSKDEARKIAAALSAQSGGDAFAGVLPTYDHSAYDSTDFYTAYQGGHSRIVELWRPVYRWVRYGLDPLFETIPDGYGMVQMDEAQLMAEVERRSILGLPQLEMDEAQYLPYYHCYFVEPTSGEVLYEQPTPYLHGEHPYSVGLARMVDGETWGVVSQAKDAQKWLNRLLVGIDYTMTSGSKGAIAYDKAFTEKTDLTDDDVNEWYSSTTGTLALNVPNGKAISDFVNREVANALPKGYFDLIPVLTDFVQRVSGITDAAQGMAPKSGTSAALYQTQVMQGTMSVLSFIQTYFDTLRAKDRKEIALVQQAYDEPRTIVDRATGEEIVYDPERVRAGDYEVALGDVTETATFRQLQEETLRADLDAGHVPYDLYLQHSARPDADALLESVREREAQQMQQQQALMEQQALAMQQGAPLPPTQ